MSLVGIVGTLDIADELACKAVGEVCHAYAGCLLGEYHSGERAALGYHVAEGKTVIVEAELHCLPQGGPLCHHREHVAMVAILRLLAHRQAIGVVYHHGIRGYKAESLGEVNICSLEAKRRWSHQQVAILVHRIGELSLVEGHCGSYLTIRRRHPKVLGTSDSRQCNDCCKQQRMEFIHISFHLEIIYIGCATIMGTQWQSPAGLPEKVKSPFPIMLRGKGLQVI